MKRWIKYLLFTLVGLYLILVLGAPYLLVSRITGTQAHMNDRENANLTPASFSLPFEDASFTSGDGVPLKGWFVPAAGTPKGTVVLVHGLFRTRIENVKKVPFINRQGWNALLFDQRGNGASGGTRRSLGYREKDDVHAAVEWARGRSPGPVVVWGISAGGAAATLAAAEDPRIVAVVCDSSFRSLRDTVGHHLQLFSGFAWYLRLLPRWLVAREATFLIGRRSQFDPDALDVRAAAARLQGRPALFVANAGDRRMPQEIAFELKAAAGERARVLVVPGNSHGGAYRDGQAAYEAAVQQLLSEAVSGGPVAVASR